MASLDKLAIRGIRSFDDKQISIIEFFTPVTVIVGHNGSGKTTIIECLKYATTGDQPPNTRGGAFVHDPKMAMEKEVKAQVKLRFRAANNNLMLVVRNLSVTMKKNGALTMKTLESILALVDVKKGKRAVISTKCAEMDTEIPHLLGVSKAVLENVIFCHQEDSYWPLSEPSVLKKKFDDIFEATKYTKALDNIKTLRKERAADLKAEKERLESLSKEKTHADKLRGRISELTSTIAAKETEYGTLKRQYEDLVKANARFYDSATKFREIYLKLDHLNADKLRFQEELATARETLKALDGTDQELTDRLQNFDSHIQKQKLKLMAEQSKQQDVEEDLASARKAHVDLMGEQGRLLAEEKAQEEQIARREALIRETAAKFSMKGYDHSPLERDKVLEFIAKLSDMRRRQNAECEMLQDEDAAKTEEYNAQSRRLHTQLEGYKQQRANLKERIATAQSRIADAESDLNKADTLKSQLRSLEMDKEEKERRIEKTRSELKANDFEQRLNNLNSKSREMETKRDTLTTEIRTLSFQADTRARLDLKRAELKTRTTELQSTLDASRSKFRVLIGTDPNVQTMEREVDHQNKEKETEHSELESESAIANKNLQVAEANLTNLKTQLKAKKDEMKTLDKEIQATLKEEGCNTIEDAISDCQDEIRIRQNELSTNSASQNFFLSVLDSGKTSKCCPLCIRDMNRDQIDVFEKTVKKHIQKASASAIRQTQDELKGWEEQLVQLQHLAVSAGKRDTLKDTEIPLLEREIKNLEDSLPELTQNAEETREKLLQVSRELKDLATLRQQATTALQAQKDMDRLKNEISTIESDLSTTGSTKTADDLQVELDTLASNLRANDRDKQMLATERDRLINTLRTSEIELSNLRVDESKLNSEIREKTTMEQRIKELKADITDCTAKLKDVDTKIANANSPIQQLDDEYQNVHRELANKISHAQQLSQELNRAADKLEEMNKTIERYVREKRGRRLKDCNEKIMEHESEITALGLKLEEVRDSIQLIHTEISQSNASIANLRENLRVRKIEQDIAATQAEIDSIDLEEAARAKRIFDEKYNVEKDRETRLQTKYAHIGGEISSLRSQLRQLEGDLDGFKNVSTKYRDQLIKVKMSDMANNDLEKYAKALDNAIMKYHSLKMEEVNDTMRHLWNKTYQGTDIDGIKISSEGEGSATKRSYNYRVVMTKDNVEMDMRGRCSAGQKMLASIIIRLALADSFGQNCGILALDEPTNALDTENIDALAASLVDIINERKSNSNFQLIIITHDENFLGKLGQSNVMEHYWRVSRDARQKSIIERHRFG